MRKVNEIGMKEDHAMNDTLRLAIRCLPGLDKVPSSDITDVFLILTDNNFFILGDNMHFFNIITLQYGLL